MHAASLKLTMHCFLSVGSLPLSISLTHTYAHTMVNIQKHATYHTRHKHTCNQSENKGGEICLPFLCGVDGQLQTHRPCTHALRHWNACTETNTQSICTSLKTPSITSAGAALLEDICSESDSKQRERKTTHACSYSKTQNDCTAHTPGCAAAASALVRLHTHTHTHSQSDTVNQTHLSASMLCNICQSI